MNRITKGLKVCGFTLKLIFGLAVGGIGFATGGPIGAVLGVLLGIASGHFLIRYLLKV